MSEAAANATTTPMLTRDVLTAALPARGFQSIRTVLLRTKRSVRTAAVVDAVVGADGSYDAGHNLVASPARLGSLFGRSALFESVSMAC